MTYRLSVKCVSLMRRLPFPISAKGFDKGKLVCKALLILLAPVFGNDTVSCAYINGTAVFTVAQRTRMLLQEQTSTAYNATYGSISPQFALPLPVGYTLFQFAIQVYGLTAADPAKFQVWHCCVRHDRAAEARNLRILHGHRSSRCQGSI